MKLRIRPDKWLSISSQDSHSMISYFSFRITMVHSPQERLVRAKHKGASDVLSCRNPVGFSVTLALGIKSDRYS
jgi:hypothetical protein